MTDQRDVRHLTDWRGNDYRVGDHVLYPRTSGRSVEMAMGQVVRIYQKAKPGWRSWDGTKWSLTPVSWETFVDIKAYKSSRFNMFNEASPTKVTISIVENITVI